jgi:hypothetical protein
LFFQGDTENPNLSMSLTVQGVPWSFPVGTGSDGRAGVFFQVDENLVLSGPGTYFSTFIFTASFFGVPLSVLSAHPGAGCLQLMCTQLFFNGGGSVTLDVVPYPNLPGSLEISKATLNFGVPEPSTMSLLLIALAGLALLGRRVLGGHRRSHATVLASG